MAAHFIRAKIGIEATGRITRLAVTFLQAKIEDAACLQRAVDPCQIRRHVGAWHMKKAEACPDAVIQIFIRQFVKADLPYLHSVKFKRHGHHVW